MCRQQSFIYQTNAISDTIFLGGTKCCYLSIFTLLNLHVFVRDEHNWDKTLHLESRWMILVSINFLTSVLSIVCSCDEWNFMEHKKVISLFCKIGYWKWPKPYIGWKILYKNLFGTFEVLLYFHFVFLNRDENNIFSSVYFKFKYLTNI